MKVYEFKADGKTVTCKGKREMDRCIFAKWFFGNLDTTKIRVTVTDTKTGRTEYKLLDEIIREN